LALQSRRWTSSQISYQPDVTRKQLLAAGCKSSDYTGPDNHQEATIAAFFYEPEPPTPSFLADKPRSTYKNCLIEWLICSPEKIEVCRHLAQWNRINPEAKVVYSVEAE